MGRLIGLPARMARRIWQRSLRTRVVTATLLLSAVVLAGLGVLLIHAVGKGLVDAQQSAALAQFEAGEQFAAATFAGPPQRTDSFDDTERGVVQTLQQSAGGGPATRGVGGQNPEYQVLILASGQKESGFTGGAELIQSDVPAQLRKQVAGNQQLAYTYVEIRATQFLLIGAPLVSDSGNGQYELYYAFSLSPQAQTLTLVESRLLAGGVALVLLLGLVAALVARQVATPVRAAARVATRLAAGRLTERLEVRGSDDLAKLATAFNGMAAALQRHIGQLEELSRAQRRFTADVSHELRTPLTTVRMAADLLHAQRGVFAPEMARSVELLHGELDRFESLLADLLEISRYDANAAELEPEPVDLAHLVREQVEWVARLARDRGTELDLSAVPSEPVYADADARRVSRILRNLLANAVEHSEGRPVEVVVAADDEAVAIRVRDHGIGMRTQDVTRVFDRFWRADPSRARQSGGSGLGLSIAREDAHLHGGWLQAWGAPGEGAAFRLTLPRRSGIELRSSPLALVPSDDSPVQRAVARTGGVV